jgi:hypothetical protein
MKQNTLELNLVAIISNNTVYVKEKDKYSSKLRQYTLRFDATEKESFNENWKVFESVPTMAEHFQKGSKSVIKYRLKDGFVTTEKTPLNMTMESFKCCDDECENSEIRGLYEPVYRKESDEWQIVDMTIEVIDMNCKPLIKQKYNYHVKFPGYIDKHMIVRHTLPCYIEGNEVYDLIREAAKKNLPDHCKITSDFDFHFEVQATVPYQNDPLRKERKKIIEISKKTYTYAGKVQDVNANNYYELEEKVDAIIKGHLDRMKTKILVCPACSGKGWIEKE